MSWVQQIDDMADSELLYRFESGLKPDARNQLSFMKAKNFDEAVMIVSRFEANRRVGREENINKLNYTKTHFPRANNKWTVKARNKVAFNKYRRPDNGSNHIVTTNNKIRRNDYKKPDQKDKFIKKSHDLKELKCYKCGRTGHMKKDCRVKIAAIAEHVGEETAAKYSSLYIHQLLSARDGNELMTINGSVNGKTVKIAIDSGCTTSIMATRTYERYKDCLNHRHSKERIKTANNQISQVRGEVTDVEINIAGHVCTMDMLIFDHEDNDILLGLDYCEKMNLGIFPGPWLWPLVYCVIE